MSRLALSRARPSRLPMPRAVRLCLAGGLALTALYLAIFAAMWQRDPALAKAMLRMYGITMVAGRETAILDALLAGLPAWAVFLLSLLDDVGTLLLGLALLWHLTVRMRGLPRLRWWAARVETKAIEHRRWLHRWGALGLAVFYFLPGWGSGMLAAIALGVLAQIPVRKVVVTLTLVSIVLDAVWTLGLRGLTRALEGVPGLRLVPLLVLAAVVAALGIQALRARGRHPDVLVPYPLEPDAGRPDWGIEGRGDHTAIDLRALAARHPGLARKRGRLVMVGELLLVPGMAPDVAEALAARLGGLGGFASASHQDLARAAGPGWQALVPLQAAAGELLARAHAGMVGDPQAGPRADGR